MGQRQETQGRQPARGGHGTAGQRPFTPEVVGKLAAVAALVVFVGEVVLSAVIDATSGATVDLVSILQSQVTGLPYDALFFAAVLWVALARGDKNSLRNGSVLAYVASFASSFLGIIIYGSQADVTTFISPLYSVLTVVGFGVLVRLYHGKTLLPGVDVRL